ncbi:transglutaminase-like domain-containing protein [Croceiramulus getboli]|nr:transglutaminase family protein [Flavobacteriaceae bacterium YJPT1-3]
MHLYTLEYATQNTYEFPPQGGLLQFQIIPEDQGSQELLSNQIQHTPGTRLEHAFSAFGVPCFRLIPVRASTTIEFSARFQVKKQETNPFDMPNRLPVHEEYKALRDLHTRVDQEPFLRLTPLTTLPQQADLPFVMDTTQGIFENLQRLNQWIYEAFSFETGVTDTATGLAAILNTRKGVCQDFTHLFIAFAKANHIPARYVSGYLHQGHGFQGDAQMHAWAECYLPHVGWKGFDPTNNILTDVNHIKVCHGKDYTDCAPLKGVLFSSGSNSTTYTVKVETQQQQQQ